MANTTTLTLNVTEQQLELVTDTSIASGGLKDILIHFGFKDTTWDGLSLRAVFKANNELTAYSAEVDSTTYNVTVPAEVLAKNGVMWVGLAGSITSEGVATLIRTSAVLGIKIEKGTPSVYEESEESERLWAGVSEMWATGGSSSGTPSATNNSKYYCEQSQTSAEQAESYKNTAKDYMDDAQTAKTDAETAKADAVSAKESAESAKTSAETASATATTKATESSASATLAGQYAETAEQYAESLDADAMVRKDSNVEEFEGTFADMLVEQMDGDNADSIASKMSEESAKSIISQLYNEPDEAHTASITTSLPASTTATGSIGQIAFDTDNNFAYICVGTNSWKRFALTDF